MLRVPFATIVCIALGCTLPAQDPVDSRAGAAAATARRFDAGGDLDKIVWHRPFRSAQKLAREAGRVMLVKPILGGGNQPAPGGVPCGGKNDCEGSW